MQSSVIWSHSCKHPYFSSNSKMKMRTVWVCVCARQLAIAERNSYRCIPFLTNIRLSCRNYRLDTMPDSKAHANTHTQRHALEMKMYDTTVMFSLQLAISQIPSWRRSSRKCLNKTNCQLRNGHTANASETLPFSSDWLMKFSQFHHYDCVICTLCDAIPQ